MKILVLSFYYKPDLCAGSFRCTALVDELRKRKGVELDVVTTMPNRYSSFETKAQELEIESNITIKRIEIPSHKSGMIDQIKSFTSYYRAVLEYTKDKTYDYVFATSSRLFTAFLGARISRKKNIPLYLDIRDLFVDTIGDILPPFLTTFALPILNKIESYTFSSAQHINMVSEGFKSYLLDRNMSAEPSYFTNGVDDIFLHSDFNKSKNDSQKEIVILYAGNIGEGQGLHSIVPKLGAKVDSPYVIKIVGDGGKKVELENRLSNSVGGRVELLAPVSREYIIELYKEADILFLHLNDYAAFKKVLPSKVFEYAATGKPILAGVSGYAAEFILSEIENAQVFYPNDVEGAVQALAKLSLQCTNREHFKIKHSRRRIMEQMTDSILSMDSIPGSRGN